MIQVLFKLQRFYRQTTYSKIKITRSDTQAKILFIKNQTTIQNFLQQIRIDFALKQHKQLLISSSFDASILYSTVPIQARKALKETFGPQPLIPLLLNGQMFLFEVQQNKFTLCYGIECQEFNLTNNRNLPQRIAYGIVDLNDQWQNKKTVGEALNNFPLIDPKSQKEHQDREEVQLAINKAHTYIQNIQSIKKKPFLGDPTRRFVKMMLGLMSLNWGFLFAVTYGKYGWDVGEPLSYLTSIGVDLLALLGLFNLNNSLENNLTMQQQYWEKKLNLNSQKRLNNWLISYYRRQLY